MSAGQDSSQDLPAKESQNNSNHKGAGDEDYHGPEGPLCDVCREIDFINSFRPLCINCADRVKGKVPRQRELQLKLGSLARLEKNRSCPLCFLVLSCIDVYYHRELPPRASEIALRLGMPISERLNTSEISHGHSFHSYATCLEVWVCSHGLDNGSKREDDDMVGAITPLPYDIAVLGAPKSDYIPFSVPKPEAQYGLAPRKIQRFIDTDLVQKWFQNCQENHGDICEQRLAISTPNATIRLIDTEESKLVKGNFQMKYVALSYVWGAATTPLLTKTTEEILSQPGGMCADRLPRTIGDAIYLTRKLGQRYLWVDSACIVQDDEVDKGAQLPVMDSIYNLAEIVLVAAGSDSAHFGIPGTANPRIEWSRPTVSIQGYRFTTLLPHLAHRLNTTCWQSRGWTLQEYLLARRLLIFDGLQIHWNCHMAAYSEDRFAEYNTSPGLAHKNSLLGKKQPIACRIRGTVPDLVESNCPRLDYVRKVENMMARKFTDESDNLWAFLGILKILKPHFPAGYIWGIPRNDMDAMLLWDVDCSYRPISALHTVQQPGQGFHRMIFPSWSWLAKGCNVHYDSCGDWVVSKVEWHDPIAYGEDHKLHCVCTTVGCENTWSEPAILGDIDHLKLEIGENTSDFGLLHFDAPIAHLDIQLGVGLTLPSGCDHEGHILAVAEILLPDGHVIGTIKCPLSFFLKKKIDQDEDVSIVEKCQAEFIHLSTHKRAIVSETGLPNFCQDDYSSGDGTEDWHAPGCKFADNVNLMMIGWDNENKIAYRIGLARIQESEWERVKTYPKTIILG